MKATDIKKTLDVDSGIVVNQNPLQIDKGKGPAEPIPQKSTTPRQVVGRVFKDGKLVPDYVDTPEGKAHASGRTWDQMKKKK